MPGAKRKIDEDTWIVSQSKKFKQGILLSNVYDTTLAHLRLGARNFFDALMMRSGNASVEPMAGPSASSPARSHGGTSPVSTPPGSPLVQDIISENELQVQTTPVPRPSVVCQDCVLRSRSPQGNEELYGKCSYCDKLVCHLNPCRGCGIGFCGQCSITKYDNPSSDTYECYSCLH
ncbi:hypothetical protein Ocin01_09581 [Orchesella cincta]|uniref:Apoptosis regulatory protein Siva n=1 Tax=Orchesella cincta TaxID=48709 RepID=A0A1D2MVZ9_ORCCI|nr:hypothetical protein Ocin01_09581 [Orchesella cincta]